ncbi:hypothetical protein EVAR_75995_1 [Eumeta japonica]|uniref:Uncharacterized protein n=1 Tax=Eumeta variegata TaxID=151549 RepID=A0A4C1UA72_EUMVA|nr:hypothetical protein EVAR_75995_1 [Eumeta japonica]
MYDGVSFGLMSPVDRAFADVPLDQTSVERRHLVIGLAPIAHHNDPVRLYGLGTGDGLCHQCENYAMDAVILFL